MIVRNFIQALVFFCIFLGVLFLPSFVSRVDCYKYSQLTNQKTHYSEKRGCSIMYRNYYVPIGSVRFDLNPI